MYFIVFPLVSPSSVVEAIAKFDVDFAWVVPVEAAEGDAVIEFHAAICDVYRVQGSGEALAEIFAKRKIEGGVLRQIVAGIGLGGECVAESGAVVNIGGSVGMPGKCNVAAEVERVALVVIERG